MAPVVDQVPVTDRFSEDIRMKVFKNHNFHVFLISGQSLVTFWCRYLTSTIFSFCFRMFPKQDITNILLLTTFSGTSAWLWRRPHIAGTLPSRRFPWVFLGSSMFTLGSVLTWAIIRSTIGRHPTICIMLGLTSGAAFTYSAIDYFKYLDKDFEPLGDIMDGANQSDEEKYDLDL